MDTPKELPGRLTLTSDGSADDVSLEEGPSGLCWPVTTYEYRIVDGVLKLVIEADVPPAVMARKAEPPRAAAYGSFAAMCQEYHDALDLNHRMRRRESFV